MKMPLSLFLRRLQIVLFTLILLSLILLIAYFGIYSSTGAPIGSDYLWVQSVQLAYCIVCPVLYGVSIWAARPFIHWAIRLFFFFCGVLGGWMFIIVVAAIDIAYGDMLSCNSVSDPRNTLSGTGKQLLPVMPTLCGLDETLFALTCLIVPCIVVELVIATIVKVRSKRGQLRSQVEALQRQLDEQQQVILQKQAGSGGGQFQYQYQQQGVGDQQTLQVQLQQVQAQLYHLQQQYQQQQQQQQQQTYAYQAPILMLPAGAQGRPLPQLPADQHQHPQGQVQDDPELLQVK